MALSPKTRGDDSPENQEDDYVPLRVPDDNCWDGSRATKNWLYFARPYKIIKNP